MALPKKLYEGFAKFFEQPTRTALRNLLKNSIGEINEIDYKEVLPDKYKLAKHVLAFANSGGGVLVIGVKDGESPKPVGLHEVEDKSDISNKIDPYLPSSIDYEVLDFSYNESEYGILEGKSFQAIIIESDVKKLPYLCKKEGNGIKDNVIYVRKGTNSTIAEHDEIQKIINKRIESGYSTSNIINLEEHLDQLEVLYDKISPSKTFMRLSGMGNLQKVMNNAFVEKEPNPNFPDEDFEQFIARAIKLKKEAILNSLGV